MEIDSRHVFKDSKLMRLGHTTGSCAAAASKAAAMMLLTQRPVNTVRLMTPKGIELNLDIEDAVFTTGYASCAVRKDGGDDTDCTHGTLIYSRVSRSEKGINIDGGEGVGRITRKGLDQPIGNAAINHVPREMIAREIRGVCDSYGYDGGVDVMISAPDGKELAKKTFNPRLGIVDGISIIGTSGIVEPMSEAAMIDTMRLEAKVATAAGKRHLLFVPGNYGKDFLRMYPNVKDRDSIKCSNYIGEALDTAMELGAESALFVGNIGKMVKIAGGLMNTHSKYGDCRMEILAACSAKAGMGIGDIRKILNCVTTDDALDIIYGSEFKDAVMDGMIEKIAFNLKNRVHGGLETGAIVFSSKYGKIVETPNANDMMRRMGRP